MIRRRRPSAIPSASASAPDTCALYGVDYHLVVDGSVCCWAPGQPPLSDGNVIRWSGGGPDNSGSPVVFNFVKRFAEAGNNDPVNPASDQFYLAVKGQTSDGPLYVRSSPLHSELEVAQWTPCSQGAGDNCDQEFLLALTSKGTSLYTGPNSGWDSSEAPYLCIGLQFHLCLIYAQTQSSYFLCRYDDSDNPPQDTPLFLWDNWQSDGSEYSLSSCFVVPAGSSAWTQNCPDCDEQAADWTTVTVADNSDCDCRIGWTRVYVSQSDCKSDCPSAPPPAPSDRWTCDPTQQTCTRVSQGDDGYPSAYPDKPTCDTACSATPPTPSPPGPAPPPAGGGVLSEYKWYIVGSGVGIVVLIALIFIIFIAISHKAK